MKGMAIIVEIRELRNQGLTKTAVAQMLGVDRGTVSKYWEGPIDDVTPPRYKERTSKVKPYKKYIIDRLNKYPKLSAKRLYQEICKDGYTGSERSVRRYIAKLRPHNFREYKPVEVLPGEQAQVDWGHFGTIIEKGKRLKLYAFVFTLSWSRVMYVEFVTSLNMCYFAGCLHRAFQYINGVPEKILFDNAKTVVAERVGSIVRFNEDLLRLSIRYNFSPKACWINDPESKGRVESNVKYLKNGFFYGLEYKDRDHLNKEAWKWLDEVANQRIHGTTHEMPAKQLEIEKPYLRPFFTGDGPSGVLEARQVSKHGLISVEGNFYSVPSQYQRKKVNIRRFEEAIEILEKNEVVYRHNLTEGRGKTVVIDEHYPQHNQKKRRSNPLQEKFEALCPEASEYLQKLSQSGTGSLRDQMEKIIDLGKLYTPEEMSDAMDRSLTFNAFGYGTLKRILEKQTKAPNSLPNPVHKKDTKNFNDLQRNPSYYSGVGL